MHKVTFDSETSTVPSAGTCYMCGATEFEPVLTVSKAQFLKDDLTLVKCKSCASVYFLGDDPVVGYDFEGFNENYWYNYVQNGAGISAMLEPLLGLDKPRQGSVLDVGCGFGFVPHFWQEMGYGEAVGLETSRYGQIGREMLGTNIIHKYYNDAEEIRGRKFDYVFSSEVIEHVTRPREFLDEISQGLSDDGVLVLTTPSATTITPDCEPTTLIATLSPGFHYFIASRSALENLLKSVGFEHVVVRDAGHRLFAWASHAPLPKISDGFSDWDVYLEYLEKLSNHPDKHIASGGMYRLFKDSLNLGRTKQAEEIYPRFEALLKSEFNIDFMDAAASEAWRRKRTGLENETYPSWMGCAFYFAGVHAQNTGLSKQIQFDLFSAAVETMHQELELAAQFAGEPAHFLPFAKKRLSEVQSTLKNTPPLVIKEVAPLEPLEDADVCLLSIYAPDGKILPTTQTYIKTLAANGIKVVAGVALDVNAAPNSAAQVHSADTEQLFENAVDLESLDGSSLIILRQNSGYDFGMWADTLRVCPHLWHAKRLFFANDSVFVIPKLFGPMIRKIRESEADFIALTDCSLPKFHTQSYFFALQNSAPKSEKLRHFWDRVENLKNKSDVIENYEINLGEVIGADPDLTSATLFGSETLFGSTPVDRLRKWNPCHFFWDRLVESGFPFVKAELLRDNPMQLPLDTVYDLLEHYGADVAMFKDSIKTSRKNRPRHTGSSKNDIGTGFYSLLRELNRARLKVRRRRLAEKDKSS